MATASVQPKKKQEPVGKKIPLCTFLKWNVEEVLDYKTEIIDGMTYVVKIYCKMCVKHIHSVERDDKMKGVARAGFHISHKKALLDYTSRAFRNALLVLA